MEYGASVELVSWAASRRYYTAGNRGRLADFSEGGRTPATINRYRALLSLVYSLAYRNGKVSVNPAQLVRLRKENNARVRFLDNDEEAKLREKIRLLYPEREPEFDLALHTGMRRGEQFGLRKQDADFNIGVITIPRSKHGGRRHIPINRAARQASEILLSHQPDSIYVSPGPEKSRGRDSQRWFEECVQEARAF